MSAMKELYTEAVEEFQKWTDRTVGDEPDIDMWVEAYMRGYANGTRGGIEASWKTTWREEVR